ncbi:MAG: SurA N-terminal domain-containing protein [Elusimicrobiota bacterium]|jgi:parvulin-like peptidyl-prolyl isomerase|nr:SurA N-terminal domain-containing protein [Elusimicrobiota bacterium]
MRKLALAAAALLIAVVFAVDSYCADRTLAVVNGEAIFESEFSVVVNPLIEQYRQTTPQANQTIAEINQRKDAVLDRLVEFTILKQEAKKQKVTATSQEVRDAMSQVRQNFQDDNAFNEALKKENLTRAKFEARISDQLTVNKFVNQTIETKVVRPTEAQVRTFYDKVKIKGQNGSTGLSVEDDQFAGQVSAWLKRYVGEQVKLRQIFIYAPKTASADTIKNADAKVAEIKKQLASGKGENFAQVAAQYSDDDASRQRGGDMGIIAKGDLVADIDKVVFSLRTGRYTTSPVRINDSGYYFFKVEEKIAPKEVNFDDVKNQIANAYFQNEANKYYAKMIADFKARANIKLNKDW